MKSLNKGFDVTVEIVYPNGDVIVRVDNGDSEYMTKEEYEEFRKNRKNL